MRDVVKDGLTTTEREELRKLRRENRRLREEREISKKAAAWFARQSESMSKGWGTVVLFLPYRVPVVPKPDVCME